MVVAESSFTSLLENSQEMMAIISIAMQQQQASGETMIRLSI